MKKFRTMACLWSCCICLVLHPIAGTAQQSQRLINGWEFLRGDLGGIWEAVRPAAPGSPESVPLWQPVSLPHCVNARDAVDPDENYYQGPSWYRTRLAVNNPYPGGRTLLHFEGAGQKTEVFVYTTRVGTHTGGYDEFDVDITDAINAFRKSPEFDSMFKGTIPVSIRVDNSRDLEMIPSDMSDFTIYGGIYRYLDLIYRPAVSLERLFITPRVDSAGREGGIAISTRFSQPVKPQEVVLSLRLIDPQGNIIDKLTRKVNTASPVSGIEFSIRQPQLWSPDHPLLYTVEADAGEFHMVEKTAFRNFQFARHGPFFLNGRRLLLRGTHRHEDHAGIGAALTEDIMRREMIMIKNMGANFIRLAHYQQSPIILRLCDSLGILVWEEIPWCRGGLGGKAYQEQAKRMLTNMIEQHYNHPSVIIWGLGNENDWPGDFSQFDKQQIRSFMKELNGIAHALYPNRKTAIRRCDFCSDIVDVYSPSIWAGWYRGNYTEYKKAAESEMKKVNHFFHAEWGGDSHAGRFSEYPDQVLAQIKKTGSTDERSGDASLFGGAARVSKDGDWSESYICNLFDWYLKEQETMSWLTGSAQWVFKDFATPLRPDNPVPYVNQKGVVERDLTPKEGYYVFQSYWATRPMAHLFGHNWPVRWGSEGEEKMIKLYSNCEKAELFVNGKSFGVKYRNSQDFPAAGLRWYVPMHQGIYQLKAVATAGNKVIEDTLSFRYQSARWEAPAAADLHEIHNENGIITAEVTVADQHGVRCLDSRAWVRFGFTGEGDLLDDLGTASGSRYVQLYNGRAIIRIRSAGPGVLSARVKGLPVVFLNL